MKLPKDLSQGPAIRYAGFTLIELLIVIAIISLLATIGVVTYSGLQKDAKDAKRKSDIETISTVLESNYSPGLNPYPSVSGSLFTEGFVPIPPAGTLDSLGVGETSYIFISVDDSNNWVSTLAGGNRYKVCAHLEKPTGNAIDEVGTFINSNNGAYYCKANQQ